MFTDYRKAVAAFGELRRMMRSGGGGSSHPIPPAHARVSAATPIGAPSSSTTATSDEITQLQRLLTQRDTEIGVLIPMVNQYKARVRALEGAAATSANGAPVPLSQRKSGAAVPNLADSAYSSTASLDAAQMHSRASIKREAGGPLSPARRPENESTASLLPAVPTARAPAAPIGDRTELIEAFKASYVPLASIEAQKAALKECYARAKTLGAEAQAMRERISAFLHFHGGPFRILPTI
ncbi:hypothetical protein BC828DRAFT_149078 [Blastocladiella britannica]|nr:hypothetical protein BC828DRAFT_149078 [Blastocladiella britannica]